MIIWGGFADDGMGGYTYLNTGVSYNPGGSATAISTNGAPFGRADADTVWTGSQMIVWNGTTNSPPDGARYTPGTDSWSAMSTSGEPAPPSGESAIWTGTQMIVWGGDYSIDAGGLYNPSANTWSATSIPSFYSEPSQRSQASAVWTGNALIIWGGLNKGTNLRSGGIFTTNAGWIATSMTNAPSARSGHTAVWTGTDMLVWGGAGSVPVNSGARFNLASNAWFPISTTNAPEARTFHTAVWTGREMIIFGGYDQTNLFNRTFLSDGARYSPLTDTWTNISQSPFFASARAAHTAVWTGTEMIVWGGYTDTGGLSPTFSYISTGGRYNPATDSWIGLPFGGPTGRRFHTAVWTGSEMLVWGGQTSTGSTNTGSRYNLASNTWTALPTVAAPAARERHTAVWNSHLKQMIICGGYSSVLGTTLDTGAFYDPTIDKWTTIPVIPFGGQRMDHCAVWTGAQMIIFDGNMFSGDLNSGYAYTPAMIYYFYQKP
jgi:N-acetylneuraminic acid mutarotase